MSISLLCDDGTPSRWFRRMFITLLGISVAFGHGHSPAQPPAEGDAKPIPAFARVRSGPGKLKEKILLENGGTAASEAAIAKGLEFLALHQAPDGHWSLHEFNLHARTKPLPAGKRIGDNSQPMTKRKNDTAGTAFGLLPFLAAGITDKPPTKIKQFDYSKCVELGLASLMKGQSQAKEDLGYFGGDMYAHGLASIAMCEAYALTSDPRYKKSAQLALDYIISAQDPDGGGWRYTPRKPGDLSMTGWQLMALKSGQMAGLTVPRTALKKAEKFIDSCESDKKGGYGYMPGTGEASAVTAVGALCRQYLGINPRNPSLLGSIKRIKTMPPASNGEELYREYYATQVMFHTGGDAWTYWNLGPDGTGKTGIRDRLIARQDRGEGGRPGQGGSFAGNEHVGGRLGATSLSLLTLEVYYRYPPLYRREKAEK